MKHIVIGRKDYNLMNMKMMKGIIRLYRCYWVTLEEGSGGGARKQLIEKMRAIN